MEAVRGDGTRFAIVIILRQITLACGSYTPAICQDVSEQRYLVTRLRNELDQERPLARTDPLTSIANIRSFRAELERSIERLSQYGRHFTLISIDLDNFKPINHDYGHAEGGAKCSKTWGIPSGLAFVAAISQHASVRRICGVAS
ncbi:hypothetical protein AWH63_18490 [Marinobacter sp. C18]|nr:hypothetical protein ACP86_20265 [Marinobacter sp. CP1]OLF84310.1 hypothetical protein AWH63_18490 [Marinobacter sp. C18]